MNVESPVDVQWLSYEGTGFQIGKITTLGELGVQYKWCQFWSRNPILPILAPHPLKRVPNICKFPTKPFRWDSLGVSITFEKGDSINYIPLIPTNSSQVRKIFLPEIPWPSDGRCAKLHPPRPPRPPGERPGLGHSARGPPPRRPDEGEIPGPHIYIYIFIYLFIYLFIYIYLFIHLFIYLFYLFIHLFILFIYLWFMWVIFFMQI